MGTSAGLHCVRVQCGKARGYRGGRGLCAVCYDRLSRLVRAGETTWAKLEAAGEAVPVRTPRQRSEWLFRACQGGN